jgi:hypothetical protein
MPKSLTPDQKRRAKANRLMREILRVGGDIEMDGSWHPEDMKAFQAELPEIKRQLLKRMLEL